MITKPDGTYSKVILAVIAILLSGVLSWGVWMTNRVYSADKDKEVASQKVIRICEDIDEVKWDIKSLKSEVKEQNEKMNRNQEMILEKLIEINKGAKAK
jgi:uncharacterized protein YlxW (UPF0749 family)